MMNRQTRRQAQAAVANSRVGKALLPLVAGLALAWPGVASAAKVDLGWEGVDANWVTNLTAGVGLRTKAPSCALSGSPAGCGSAANTAVWANGDDGNLNYRKNQAYTGYLSATSEILLNQKEQGWKFLARGTGLYDFVADKTKRTELSSEARDQAVHSGKLLDFWLQKDFTLGEQRAHLRLGNQVINWGESYYASGGINASNSLDIQKTLIPGTQLKQALLPAPMLSFASSLPGGWSTEAYYQLQWNSNIYPPVGAFWSTSDVFGRGAQNASFNSGNFNLAGVDAAYIAKSLNLNSRDPRVIRDIGARLLNGDFSGAPFNAVGGIYQTVLPGHQPQYGIRFGYKPTWTDATFGFYYENYTDKAPVLSYLASGVSQWSYLKHRDLYGVSTNFQLGNWALGGELSYRPRDAVALTGCFAAGGPADLNSNGLAVASDCQAFRNNKKYQFDFNAQLNMTKTSHPWLRHLGADLGVFTTELTWVRYPGVSDNRRYARTVNGQAAYQLVAAAYGTWLDQNSGLGYPIAQGKGSTNSVGLTIDFNVTYDGTVIPGWQVTPGITFYDAVKGNTPTFSANYEQGAKSAYAYLLFNKNPQSWQAGISYVGYWGGNPISQPYADRNALGMFLTRNF
jgi:hypothetical protein